MNNCNACRGKMNNENFLKCKQCCQKYHLNCVNVTSSAFGTFTKEYRAAWTCTACNNVSRRNKTNSNTSPIRSFYENNDKYMNVSGDKVDGSVVNSSSQIVTKDVPITLESISQLLDNKLQTYFSGFMSDVRSAIQQDIIGHIHSEIDPMIKQLREDFSKTTDFICAGQNDLKENFSTKDRIIKQLETENLKLQNSVKELNSRLVGLEKTSRACNVEIQSLPESKNENVIDLFKKLCTVIGLPIDEKSIRACHRVAKMDQNSKRPRNLLVSLTSSYQRDQVISAALRYNKKHHDNMLNSFHLGVAGESRRIYVTEHLSPSIKIIYAEARKIAKNINYKYVWARFGKVFVRKDDSAAAIYIGNIDSLSKLQ